MACSLAECDAMVDAVERHGVKFNLGTTRRWHPAVFALRALIESGDLGRLRAVVAFGGGPLLHGGSHSCDLLLRLAGDPALEWVQGTVEVGTAGGDAGWDERSDHVPRDLAGSGQCRFAGGVMAYNLDAGPGGEFEVLGSEGIARIRNNGGDWELWRRGPRSGWVPAGVQSGAVSGVPPDQPQHQPAERPPGRGADRGRHPGKRARRPRRHRAGAGHRRVAPPGRGTCPLSDRQPRAVYGVQVATDDGVQVATEKTEKRRSRGEYGQLLVTGSSGDVPRAAVRRAESADVPRQRRGPGGKRRAGGLRRGAAGGAGCGAQHARDAQLRLRPAGDQSGSGGLAGRAPGLEPAERQDHAAPGRRAGGDRHHQAQGAARRQHDPRT